jgi:hypothetical protein
MTAFNVNTILFFILLISLSNVNAREVFLYDDFDQTDDYDFEMSNVSSGDILNFENGKYRYYVVRNIGHGRNSEVFEVLQISPSEFRERRVALRLPISSGAGDTGGLYTETLNTFVDGHGDLEKNGVRVPKLYDHVPGQFVAVEFVDSMFDFNEFLKNPSEYPDHIVKEAEEAFYKFVKEISPYNTIGDFHGEQIIYNFENKEWVLADFTGEHDEALDLFKSFDKLRSINSNLKVLEYDYLGEVDEIDQSQMSKRLFKKSKEIINEHDIKMQEKLVKCFSSILDKSLSIK